MSCASRHELRSARAEAAEPSVGGAARRWPWRGALALCGGALLYAGHPPLELSWAGLLALAPLVALARELSQTRRPLRAGLGWGLLAGVVFFAALLSWIWRFGVAPWTLLVLVEALSVGVFVALLAWWGTRRLRWLAAVALWVGLEALRSQWPLGGFPWGVLGYTQHAGGALLPLARVTGVLGVSAALAASAVAAEAAVHRLRTLPALRARAGGRRAGRGAERAGALGVGAVLGSAGRAAAPLVAVPALLVLGLLAAGLGPPAPTGERLDVAAVQPNDVEHPGALDGRRSVVVAEQAATLTRRTTDAAGVPQLVVWPESAVDGEVRDGADPALAAPAAETAAALGSEGTLLAGMILDGEQPGTFLNAMARVGADGAPEGALYLKRRLVPFGEYVPGRRWLEWYGALDQVPRDAVPGSAPRVFDVAGHRVGTVICFDNVFPGIVRDAATAGAELLVVSTNNASYGRSPMSDQHLAVSRLRAVETGRWVVHGGVSGKSAIIDPTGDSGEETGVFEQAVLRAEVPLVAEPTPFVRNGDLVGPAAMAGSVLALVLAGARSWRERRRRQRG